MFGGRLEASDATWKLMAAKWEPTDPVGGCWELIGTTFEPSEAE